MTPNEAAKQRAETANAIMEVNDQFAPLLDAADGMRADLERRGWSPTAAETAALQYLMSLMGAAFKGGAA